MLSRLFFIVFLASVCFPLLSFEQYETFSENGKFGLIEKESEEIVFAAEYEAIGWSSGNFKVIGGTIGLKRNEKWALASVEGDRITVHEFTVLYPFGSAFIAGKRSRFSILNEYGVINTKGKAVIPIEYNQLKPFSNKLIAGVRDKGSNRFGVLSNSGKTLIPITYRDISPIEEGIIAIKDDSGLSAIFTEEGNQRSAFDFESISTYDSNYLLVKYYNRKGLVTHDGKVVVPPIYKELKFEEGKAQALPFTRWSLFSDTPSEFFFDNMVALTDKVFAVQSGENLALIDAKETYLYYFEGLEIVSAGFGLLTVTDGQQMGVLNAAGKTVLPLSFDNIRLNPKSIYGEDKNKSGQNWKVYDHMGVLKSRQPYESFKVLTETLVEGVRNGKRGLLNAEGREISPFIYDSIGTFSQGLAVVQYQRQTGVINQKGHWVVTPYKDEVNIHEGYMTYRQGSEKGILDLSGNLTFRSQAQLLPLTDQLLMIDEEDRKTVIDKSGNQPLENSFDKLFVLHKDLLVLQTNDKKYFYQPSTQRLTHLNKDVQSISSYAEDLIAVKIDGQWGFISEQGDLIVANRYQQVDEFSEGLCPVQLIGKWGVIDKEEKLLIQPVYDEVQAFYGGLAVVRQGNRYGLTDRSGKLILEVNYQSIRREKNYIIFESAGLKGLADARGNIIRNPQYDALSTTDNKHFLVRKGDKWGVISLSGEDTVPLAYERIQQIEGGFLAAEPSVWTRPILK